MSQRLRFERRTSSRMRSLRVAWVLWLWFVVVTAAFFTQWHFTYHSRNTVSTRISLFGVILVDDDSLVATSLWIVALWLVLSLLFCYVVAASVGRACQSVISPAKVLAYGVIFAALAAGVMCAYWARSYWGYWISRPEPAAGWWQIDRVTSFARVTCKLEGGRWRCVPEQPPSLREIANDCASDLYYCLEERLPVSLSQSGVSLPSTAPLPGTITALEAVLATRTFVVRAERGYSGDRILGGYVVSGAGVQHNQRLLAFALSGPEISNDHHPMYEAIVDVTSQPPRVVRRRVFFYDVAGIEGAEPPQMLLAATIVASSVAVPVSLAAACLVAYVRRSRNARDEEHRLTRA